MKNVLIALFVSSGTVLGTTTPTCDEAGLRSALNAGGTVTLACDGVITISNTLVISTNVVLSAAGHNVTVSGNGAMTVFRVNPGVQVTFQHLTIADGRGMAGGALYNESGTVRLEDCILRNNQADGTNRVTGVPGPAQGGAIYNAAGTIVLNGGLLVSNRVVGPIGVGLPAQPATGGALFSTNGTVAGTNVFFLDNQALGGSGSVEGFFSRPGAPATGGAVHGQETRFAFSSAVFSNNVASGGNGGSSPSTLLAGAGAAASGGALTVEGGAVVINDAKVVNNAAAGGTGGRAAPGGKASGGALSSVLSKATVLASTFAHNSVTPGFGRPETSLPQSGDGGAVFTSGTLTAEQSIFATNSTVGAGASDRGAGGAAGQGGAIFNEGTAQVIEYSFFGNQATGGNGIWGEGFSSTYRYPGTGFGGAVFNGGGLAVVQSTLAGNIAKGGSAGGINMSCFCTGDGGTGCGGAIYSAGTLKMTNSTLSANAAIGAPAGLTPGFGSRGNGGSASGGGLYSTALGSEIHFVTFGNNDAIGGEGRIAGTAAGGNISVAAGQLILKDTILAHGKGSQCAGIIADQGHNIASDDACSLSGIGSLNSVDPRLGPLADNGGPTLTMALLPDSPAIDGAGVIDRVAIDQRGQPRPALTRCDVGAYEEQQAVFVILSLQRVGTQVSLRGRGIASAPFRVLASAGLGSWQPAGAGNVGANGLFEVQVSTLDGPQTFYRIVSP